MQRQLSNHWISRRGAGGESDCTCAHQCGSLEKKSGTRRGNSPSGSAGRSTRENDRGSRSTGTASLSGNVSKNGGSSERRAAELSSRSATFREKSGDKGFGR